MPTTFDMTDAVVNKGIGQLVGCWHFDIHKMLSAQRLLDRSSTTQQMIDCQKGVGQVHV